MSLAEEIEELELIQDKDRIEPESKYKGMIHAKGWEKGVALDGGSGYLYSGKADSKPSDDEWLKILMEIGLDPQTYEIDPDGVVDVRAWDTNIGAGVIKRMQYYRAKVRLKSRHVWMPEGEFVAGLSAYKPPPRKVIEASYADPNGFIVCLSDWQVGKTGPEGGSASIRNRIMASAEAAMVRLSQIRKLGVEIETVYIVGMGDMVESCLAGETEIVTRNGLHTLKELAGSHVTVRSVNGRWTDAEIKSFGKQPLLKVELSRGLAKKTVYATPEHRWFRLKRPSGHPPAEEARTHELVTGNLLSTIFGRHPEGYDPEGFRHGFIHGDGHLTHRGDQGTGSAVCMHRGDWEAILPFFNGYPTSEERTHEPSERVTVTPASDYVLVSGLSVRLKSLVPLTESPRYLMGWLMGYFAADGAVTKGSAQISSADLQSVMRFKEVCSVVGIGTNQIRSQTRDTQFAKNHTMYSMTMVKQTVPGYFMIQGKHKEAFIQKEPSNYNNTATWTKNRSRYWRVESVTETDRVEEVYCAIVPDGEAFVLADDLLTGNCSGQYPSQAFVVDLNDRQQFRLAFRLFRNIVTMFSKKAKRVVVTSVGGNHGENRLNGKMFTDPGDNKDTMLIETCADALECNPDAFGHVKFVPLENKLWATLDIYGTVCGFTHGHLPGSGANPEAKQRKWLADQALGKNDIGDVDLFVTGHYHSFQVSDWGPRMWVQCPTQDGGSEWFQNIRGVRSITGTLTFVVGPACTTPADFIKVV